MSKPNKKKSSKSVSIPKKGKSKGNDNFDAKYEEALRIKKINILAEFEKHKKELFFEVQDTSKVSEAKLRSLIDELVSTNLKKKKDLNILNELHNKVKKCAEDSENFARAISPVKSQSKLQDSYIPAGFSPPRTSTTINDLKEENGEVIVEKIKELEGLLLNIKLLDEQEDETMNLLQERKKESYNDNVLLKRKVKELDDMSKHSEKRFIDLKRLGFLAQQRYEDTLSNLDEQRKLVRESISRENEYKNNQKEYGGRMVKSANELHEDFCKTLIALEEDRIAYEQYKSQLERLDMEEEEISNKKIITKSIENYTKAFDIVNNFIAQIVKEEGLSPKRKGLDSFSSDSRPKLAREDKSIAKGKKYKLDRIQSFYDKHSRGPAKLAEKIIIAYSELKIKENGLQNTFEDLQNEKVSLRKILQGFKRKLEALENACQYLSKEELEGNELSTEKTEQDAEFVPEPKTTSLIIEEQINLNTNNDKFAISTGILHNGTKTTTVSQAIDALEIQKSTDFKCSMTVMEMRAFVLRIYWTTLKIVYRFATLVVSIGQKSEGLLPDEIGKAALNLLSQTTEYLDGKKSGKECESPQEREFQKDKSLAQSFEANEERKLGWTGALDYDEVKQTFISSFPFAHNKAGEFSQRISQNVLMISFVTTSDVQNYLSQYKGKNNGIYKIMDDLTKLEELAIQNMLLRINTTFDQYSSLILSLKESKKIKDSISGTSTALHQNLNVVNMYNTPSTEGILKAPDQSKEVSASTRVKVMFDKNEFDTVPEYRWTGFSENTNSTSNRGKSRERVFERKEKQEEKKLDIESLSAKLEMITRKISPPKGRILSYKDYQKETKSKVKNSQAEKPKNNALGLSDEDHLEQERQRIKNNEPEASKDSNNLTNTKQNYMTPLSSSRPLIHDELKKMIKCSSLISKINMIEKCQSPTGIIKEFRDLLSTRHIPHRPVKISRLAEMSAVTKRSLTPASSRTHYPFSSTIQTRSPPLTERKDTEKSSPSSVFFKRSSPYKSSPKIPSLSGGLFERMKQIKSVTPIRPTKINLKSEEMHRSTSAGGSVTFRGSKTIFKDYNKGAVTERGSNKREEVSSAPLGRIDEIKGPLKCGTGMIKKRPKRTKSEENSKNINSNKSGVVFEPQQGIYSSREENLMKNILIPSFNTTKIISPIVKDNFGYNYDAYKVIIPSVLVHKTG